MVHDVGISGMGYTLVCWRRISTPSSQVPRDMTKVEAFTVFACLTIPVSIDVTQARLDKPAWDASSAFRQHVCSRLYWVIVTSEDGCNTGSALWAGTIAILVVGQ